MSIENMGLPKVSSVRNNEPAWDSQPKLKVWELILVATSALVVLIASTSVFLR